MIVIDTNVMVRLVVGGTDGTDAALLFERGDGVGGPQHPHE